MAQTDSEQLPSNLCLSPGNSLGFHHVTSASVQRVLPMLRLMMLMLMFLVFMPLMLVLMDILMLMLFVSML